MIYRHVNKNRNHDKAKNKINNKSKHFNTDIDNRSYKSHTRSFSMAEESSNVKNLLHQDAEVSTKNIKTVINYEKKIQNRVRYLAQEEKRMQAKMNVMQAKIQARDRALKQKEQDKLRMVLLKKREEAIQH